MLLVGEAYKEAMWLASRRTAGFHVTMDMDFIDPDFTPGVGARQVVGERDQQPGFTSISMYPKLWEASGLPYSGQRGHAREFRKPLVKANQHGDVLVLGE